VYYTAFSDEVLARKYATELMEVTKEASYALVEMIDINSEHSIVLTPQQELEYAADCHINLLKSQHHGDQY